MKKGKLFCLNIFYVTVFALLINYAVCDFQYPDVYRNESIEDDFFGTTVKDPYRWLEKANSELTKQFVEKQNTITLEYIRSNPNFGQVKNSFIKFYNYTYYNHPKKSGDSYYIAAQNISLNQKILYKHKDLNDSNPQVFIDTNQYSTNGSVTLVFYYFSPNGKYCAYGLSENGSDWIKIKIKDTQTLQDLDEEIVKTKKFFSVEWHKTNKGFYYAYYDTYHGTGVGTETEVAQNQKIYYHKVNTSQSEDIKIFEYSDDPMAMVGTPVLNIDGSQLNIFVSSSKQTLWIQITVDPNSILSPNEFKMILNETDLNFSYSEFVGDCLYIKTDFKSKNSRFVCIDVTNPSPENWKEIVPEHPNLVMSSSRIINKDYLVCVYLQNVVGLIKIFNLTTGEHLFDLETPIGSISSLTGEVDDSEFFYSLNTFIAPKVIYRYDFNGDPKLQVFRKSVINGFKESDYVASQVFYNSKDNTQDIVLNGKNPTLLNAYGGFGLNIQPSYNTMLMFFIKHLKGVYALANIRGGGEYGDDWHKGGMLTNKQNSFDDFAAAGEWLMENNYTSRKYLTILGRSNGGLLVGASSNQRPDLFGAALAYVGVMDMIRFPLFTIGYAWRNEYGDPQKNKTEFEYIHRYSPLHNINTNLTIYPQMLVLTADHDDRVVPAHSYKFISELQYKLGKKVPKTPLMILIDSNSGHGSGKPVDKIIEEQADVLCFLMNGMPYQYFP